MTEDSIYVTLRCTTDKQLAELKRYRRLGTYEQVKATCDHHAQMVKEREELEKKVARLQTSLTDIVLDADDMNSTGQTTFVRCVCGGMKSRGLVCPRCDNPSASSYSDWVLGDRTDHRNLSDRITDEKRAKKR